MSDMTCKVNNMTNNTSNAIHWFLVATALIAMILVQVPMAYIGTEIGWVGGVSVGVQTFKTGSKIGIRMAIVTVIIVSMILLSSKRLRSSVKGTWVMIATALIIVSVATIFLTLVRAGQSFFFYLDP